MAIRKSILLVRYVTLLKDLYKKVEVDERNYKEDEEKNKQMEINDIRV